MDIDQTNSINQADNFMGRYAQPVIIILLAIMAGALFFAFGRTNPTNPASNPSVSSHILALTLPITTVSGKVISVSNNSFTLQVQPLSSNIQGAPISPSTNSGQSSSQQKEQPITYTVMVISSTRIVQNNNPLIMVPAVLTAPTPASAQPKLSIQDVKANDVVTVISTVDLRTLQGDAFEASSVMLPSKIQTLNGTITVLGNNSLTVKGTVAGVGSVQSTQQTFHVIVDNSTSISAFTPTPPTPTKPLGAQAASFADLKKDMRVNVSFDREKASGDTVTALSIIAYQTPVPIAPLEPTSLPPVLPKP